VNKERINTVRAGLVIGLLGAAFAATGIFLYFKEWFLAHGFRGAIAYMKMFNMLVRVITLMVVPNAFLFFIFLQKDYYQTARGIMIVVFLTFLLFFI
jgi:hypothetical protein